MDGSRHRDRWKTQSEIVFRRHSECRGRKLVKKSQMLKISLLKVLPVRRGRLDPLLKKSVVLARGVSQLKKEPEWPLLLQIPLAELPQYESRGYHRGTASSSATKFRPPN